MVWPCTYGFCQTGAGNYFAGTGYIALYRIETVFKRLWAVLYSRLIWWVIWSATEELTFNGYALPRLQLITGKTWVAVLGVGFGWALQHSFLPFINVKHAIWLLITFFPLTIAIQLVYLKYRRLFPLIIGHWAMDFFSVVFLLKIG